MIVVAFDDILQGKLGEWNFGLQRGKDFLTDDPHDEVEHSFADLQNDIADESFGDNDLADALVDITAFNVTDELVFEGAVAEEILGFLSEFVALVFFGTDVEQTDPRLVAFEDV